MPSNIDVQKVVRALGETKAVNLDLTLGEIVASPAANMINSVAHIDPWDLICYTWVTLIRRRSFDEVGQRAMQAGGDLGGGRTPAGR